MRAFLLAAGLGTRLPSVTKSLPKCLAPLGGRPLLHWQMNFLERLGVEEVLINTHYKAEQVRGFFDANRYAVKVHLFHETELLGSAGTLAANKTFVRGESAYWILYADTVVGDDLSSMAAFHRESRSKLTLGLFQAPDPRSAGIVELGPGGRVLRFEEKPARPKSDLAAAGVYLAGSEFLDRLPARGDLGLDVFPKWSGECFGFPLERVLDIGTLESYERACREWSDFVRT
ncbi:MAG: nucleotidyltransferase family protein [Elusimicrobia bacterium]|nr:nucleotidyltransferase family protein [Elusimicrobiota bacterium]